jgi:hypothetical protein
MVNNLNYSENISYHKTLYGNIFKKLFKLLTTRFAFLDLNKQNSAIDISDETIQAYADSCAGLGEKLSALTKESTVENTVFFKDLMSFSYCAFLKSEKLTDFYKDNDINGEVSYK